MTPFCKTKLRGINNWVIFILRKNQLEVLESVGFRAILQYCT